MKTANQAAPNDLSSLAISRAIEAGRAAAGVDFLCGRNDAGAAFVARANVGSSLREMFVTAYQERYAEFAIAAAEKTGDTVIVLVKAADAMAVGQTLRCLSRTAPGNGTGEAMNRVGAQLVSAGMASMAQAQSEDRQICRSSTQPDTEEDPEQNEQLDTDDRHDCNAPVAEFA